MISSLASNIERLKRITGASKGCGWMYDDVAFLVYALVKFYKPDLVIQTGHLWGKSACIVLEALTDGFLGERAGLEVRRPQPQPESDLFVKFAALVNERTPKNAAPPRMISIDPWPHLMEVAAPYEGIELLKRLYPGQFEFYKMKSAQFFEQFTQDTSGLRLMGIVDGDHTPEGCLLDLKQLGQRKAELILVDDTEWLPELKPVVELFAREYNYNFLNLDLYNGIGLLTRRMTR